MSGEDLEISRRLALVERSVRRYRAALVVVGLIAAAGMVGPSLVGATKAPGTVQAKIFQVVDDNGVVRAALDTAGDDADLILYDKAENRRAVLGNTDLKIPATGSTEHRAPSSLVLLNEHGNVLWEAP